MHERDEKYAKAWLKGYNDGLLNGIGRGRTEVLDKISAEIEEKMSHYDHFQGSNTAHGLEIALEIIDKHIEGDKE